MAWIHLPRNNSLPPISRWMRFAITLARTRWLISRWRVSRRLAVKGRKFRIARLVIRGIIRPILLMSRKSNRRRWCDARPRAGRNNRFLASLGMTTNLEAATRIGHKGIRGGLTVSLNVSRNNYSDSGLSRLHNAWNGLQIANDANVVPRIEESLNLASNRSADFHDEPCAGTQSCVGLGKQACNDLDSGRSSKHGVARFIFPDLQLNLIFFRFAYIRRVGDDKVQTGEIEP